MHPISEKKKNATLLMAKKILLLLVIAASLFCSCRTSTVLPYFSDAERDAAEEILETYNSVILCGDELDIDIVSQSPESLYQFYERANASRKRDARADSLRQTFIVLPNGTIEFPPLGRVNAAGLTLDILADTICQLLRRDGYVVDPIVTIHRVNFRVTVVGEVAHPQQLYVEGNRLTIFEALAMVGDITVFGLRDNVMVMREEDGQQVMGTIDLTSRDIFDSPYYYLQQNDIVYVEPNDQMKRRANANPNIPSYIAIGVSILRMAGLLIFRTGQASSYR